MRPKGRQSGAGGQAGQISPGGTGTVWEEPPIMFQSPNGSGTTNTPTRVRQLLKKGVVKFQEVNPLFPLGVRDLVRGCGKVQHPCMCLQNTSMHCAVDTLAAAAISDTGKHSWQAGLQIGRLLTYCDCRLLRQSLLLWVSHSPQAPPPQHTSPSYSRGGLPVGGLSPVLAPLCHAGGPATRMQMLARSLSLSGMLAVQQT